MSREILPVLMDSLLLVPLLGALLMRLSVRDQGRVRKLSFGVFGLEFLLAMGTGWSLLNHGRSMEFGMLLSVVVLGVLCVPLGVMGRNASNPKLEHGRVLLAFLMLFFSAGFLLSPSSVWSILFWGGVLFTARRMERAFSGEADPRRESLGPAMTVSLILFPASQVLSGNLPYFPSADFGLGAVQAGAFGFAALAFLMFCPFFPFQRWLSFVPVSGELTPWISLRVILLFLAALGLLRWAIPLENPSFSASLPILLGLSLTAQLQGGLLALGEPVLRKRIAALLFSQSALIVPTLFLTGREHPWVVVVLGISLMLPAILLAVATDHLEIETRRQSLRDWSGLHRDMPRTDRLFLVASLAFSAVPGFGAFSGLAMVASGSPLSVPWFWSLLPLAGVVLVQGVLWKTWESIFLGPPMTVQLVPEDFPAAAFWKFAVFLVPVLLLGAGPFILWAHFPWKGGP
ncbi:MAG: proton-conducting transporter transmembrane domain-containing protein [Leptospirales bacterium]